MEYTNADLEKLTGITKRKIQFLVDSEIIVPTKRGRGKSIIYSDRNRVELLMIKRFQEHHNLRNSTIARIFAKLREAEQRGVGFDFFTEKGWGINRDLIYTEAFVDSKSGNFSYSINQVDLDAEKRYRIPIGTMNIMHEAVGPVIIVPLGKVKVKAMA